MGHAFVRPMVIRVLYAGVIIPNGKSNEPVAAGVSDNWENINARLSLNDRLK